MRIITCGRKVRGTCHADDLSYLFYNAAAKKLKRHTDEFRTIKRLVSMLVHFAATGKPSIALYPPEEPNGQTTGVQPEVWLPISRQDAVFKCLNISKDVHVIELPEADKLWLWDSMYADKQLLY